MRHPRRRGLQAILGGLVAWTLGVGAIGTPAHAAFVFDPDGASATNAPTLVGGFVFSTGNVLAQNSAVPGGGGTLQPTFTILGQASLSGYTDTAGNPAGAPIGLNTPGGFEITVVVRAVETVLSQAAAPGAATFSISTIQPATSFFEIYFDTARDANPLAGTGYNNGTLILQGTPNGFLRSDGTFTATGTSPTFDMFPPDGSGNNYPGIATLVGSGSATLTSLIEAVDTNFFSAALLNNMAFGFNTLNRTPFDQTNPSALFAGTRNTTGIGTAGAAPAVAPNLGPTNGAGAGGGTDFQFQTLPNGTVVAVPEPASLTLMGLGLAGSLGFGWRKRQRRSV